MSDSLEFTEITNPTEPTVTRSVPQSSEPVVDSTLNPIAPIADVDHTLRASRERRAALSAVRKRDQGSPTAPTTQFSAWYETNLRKSKTLMHSLTLVPIYLASACLLGIAVAPAVALFSYVSSAVAGSNDFVRFLTMGLAFSFGYFVYGFTLLVVAAVANLPVRRLMKPARGPYYSSKFVPWCVHNSLLYIVRYTFLDFITPTPINIAFLRWMGMKIGKNCQVNTSLISDPALITLEDKVTLGGSVTICAHYGTGGFLIIAPVVIRNGATVGLKCTILGGVEIGERAVVLPNSAILPKTKIPAGETWGGVPARKIDFRAGR